MYLKKHPNYNKFPTKCRFRFDCEQPNFFDAGTRIYIINFILERQHFIEGEETPDNLGIEKLLADGVYESAYTLHDVSIITPFDFKIFSEKVNFNPNYFPGYRQRSTVK